MTPATTPTQQPDLAAQPAPVMAELASGAEASVLQEFTIPAAVQAAELDLLCAEGAEDGVGAGASSLEQGAAAMVATVPPRVACLSRLKLAARLLVLRLKLIQPRLHVMQLQLQILVLRLKCRVLRLDEADVLAKHCRRAVFGDQLVKKFENACHIALLDVVKVKRQKHTPASKEAA